MEKRLPHSATIDIAYPPSDIALRSPSGPAPQTLALSEKSPYPRSSPNLGQPVARPTFLPRTASEVGTDLRAVRTADIGAFGEIALPQKLT